MGNYDIPILVGGAVVIGYFVLQNPDFLQGIFPQGDPNPDSTTGDGTDTGTTDSSTSASPSICGQLCRDKMCTTYKSKCKTGCVNCCGSGGNSPKCSGGGGGGSGNVSRSYNDCQSKYAGGCNTECAGGCTSRCKGCHQACGGNCSSSSEVTLPAGQGKGGQMFNANCPEKVISANCAGDCKKTCWHGQITPGHITDVCVDQGISSSACSAARSKFLAKYSSGMAFAYRGSQLAAYAAMTNPTNSSISVS